MSRPDLKASPVVHVSVIKGGLWGWDGNLDSRGMIDLYYSIKQIPGVDAFLWEWDQYDNVFDKLRGLSPETKRVLVGYSGGGSRITWIANLRPRQRIDLVIGYDPSPTWQMEPLTTNVQKAICYYNPLPCPMFGGLGGGKFAGLPKEDIEIIPICEWHLSVQSEPNLHRHTLRAIAKLRQVPMSDTKLKKLLTDGMLRSKTMLNDALANLQGFGVAPTANPVRNPESFSTEQSTSHNYNGHSTTEGLHGTLQKYDDGSIVIEATEVLIAYRKDIGLSQTLTAFCRRTQKCNEITVEQANYSYKGRQLAPSSLFLQSNGIPIGAPVGFEGTPVRTAKATRFGKHDKEGEGTGTPYMGLIQTNSELFGASVKMSVIKKIFGQRWTKNDKRLTAMVEIFFARKGQHGRMVRVPLVDVSPAEKAKSRIEVGLTWACDQFLETEGGAKIQYRLLLPSTQPARGKGTASRKADRH
jgi:hypothetical protein